MTEQERQIEEMARRLEEARELAIATVGSMNNGFGGWYAKQLYKNGYRKEKESVKDFVKTLKERFEMTSTIATSLHGRRDTEIMSIIDAVADDYDTYRGKEESEASKRVAVLERAIKIYQDYYGDVRFFNFDVAIKQAEKELKGDE